MTAANNTTTSSRSVTYTATHEGKSATCTVTQSAGSKQYASWSDWTVTVSANPTTIARTGGTSTIPHPLPVPAPGHGTVFPVPVVPSQRRVLLH